MALASEAITAQEILDREGFVPICSHIPYEVGDVVEMANSRSVIPFGTKLKITGTLTREQFYILTEKYHPGRNPGHGPYFFKVIAE
jgi:hypothetical protein